MAIPVEWLNEFQVNTGTAATGGQSDPVIVGLSNGNILVAWEEAVGGAIGTTAGSDIIGKIYDAEGNVVRDSFQLNSSWFADDEEDFDVAATNDGGFVLVYVDDDIASVNQTSIAYERFDSTGTQTSSGQLADENVAADNLANPQVTVNQHDNSFMVTYTDNVGGNDDIRARFVNAAGTAGAEFDAGRNNVIDDDRRGDVAILTNGDFVSVYEEDDAGTFGVEFEIFQSDGTSVAGPTNISGGTNARPQVAALANGNFVMAWEASFTENGNIEYEIRSPIGGVVSGTLSAATGADQQNEPEVIALPDGGFVIVWDNDTDNTLEAQRFDATGAVDGGTFIVENVGTTRPNVGVTPDGRILFTWDAEGNEIHASIWDPRGSTINASDLQMGLRNFADAEVITAGTGATTIIGAAADESLIGSTAGDWLIGGGGADTIDGRGGNDILRGDTGRDLLLGDAGRDNLFGGNQRDELHGEAGRDLLRGNSGNDSLFGGGGRDTLRGDAGNDKLYGDGSSDTMRGNAGKDRLFGDNGSDQLNGGSGKDTLKGNDGRDEVFGGNQSDRLFGNGGNDLLRGDGGGDRLFGGSGNDTLRGDGGHDRLFGGGGSDMLRGGGGHDRLFGGSGNDTALFAGNAGRYTFSELANGNVVVVDTVGGLGSDILNNIEQVTFSGGGTFDIDDLLM